MREYTQVAWFEADAVPQLEPFQAKCLALALADHADPWFVGSFGHDSMAAAARQKGAIPW